MRYIITIEKGNNNMIDIGNRISQLRQQKGITVNRLANLAGISQSYLRDVELGKKQPTILYLSYICDALGIELKEFFSEDDPKELVNEQLLLEIEQLTPRQRNALLAFLKTI